MDMDDETYRFMTVNQAALECYGYSESEFLSMTLAAIHLTDDQLALQNVFSQQQHPFLETIQSRHQKKDGTVIIVEVRWHPLRFNGRVARLVVATDVTERLRATAEIETRTRELLNIWESITDAFLATDAEWRIIQVNSQALHIWRKSREEVLGKSLWSIFPEALDSIIYRECCRARDNQISVEFEAFYPPLEGWYENHVYPSGGGISVYFRDITERKRVEVALRESEDRNRRIVETAQEGIWLVDDQFHTLYVNRRMAEILGYSEAEMSGRSPEEFMFDEDKATHRLRMKRRREGKRENYDTRYRCKNGHEVWLLGNGQPIMEDGVFTGAFAMFTDITERKQATAERERLLKQVSAGRAKLQVLSRRLVEAQETERRSLARELHDEIGQSLTGLKLMLEMNSRAQSVLQTDPFALDASVAPLFDLQPPKLETAIELVNDLMNQVRELSLTLRPTMLDDFGLLSALLWHFERYEVQTRVKVFFKHTNLENRFSPAVETAAYRIVQEALTNVARHARISEVNVQLSADEDILSLEIRDAGAGFDTKNDTVLKSSGLTGMRERALLLQGQLEICSEPGAGTIVAGELPLHAETVEEIERRYEAR